MSLCPQKEFLNISSCYLVCIYFELLMLIMFQIKEINTFLNDIIRHMAPDRVYEKYYPQLKTVVENVVNYSQDFEALLAMVRNYNTYIIYSLGLYV